MKLTREEVIQKVQAGERLEGYDLSHLDLSHADFKRADFYNANLQGVSFIGSNLAGSNLNSACLMNCDLSGVDLKGATIKKADVKGAKLVEAKMMGVNMEASDLSEADLKGANLVYANFNKATMVKVNLTDANLMGANLSNTVMLGVKFTGAKLVYAVLRGANLEGATLEGAILVGADLREVNLTGADLKGVKLWGAKLSGAQLRHANMVGANLVGANMEAADLTSARMLEANLLKANIKIGMLKKADLDRANLVETNLSGANLEEASLNGTDLSYADLTGADLRYAKLNNCNLSFANITGAKIHGTARWNVKTNGVVAENLDFSKDGDSSQIREISSVKLGELFTKATPTIKVSFDKEAENEAMVELFCYLTAIDRNYKEIGLKLQSLETISGTTNFVLMVNDESNLFVAFHLFLNCIKISKELNKEEMADQLKKSINEIKAKYQQGFKGFWQGLPLLKDFNQVKDISSEEDFFSVKNLRKITIKTSTDENYILLTDSEGNLRVDATGSDVFAQLKSYLLHTLKSTDKNDALRELDAFEHFYERVLDSESLRQDIIENAREISIDFFEEDQKSREEVIAFYNSLSENKIAQHLVEALTEDKKLE